MGEVVFEMGMGVWDLNSSMNYELMHLFWVACKCIFNFLFMFGYQALHA